MKRTIYQCDRCSKTSEQEEFPGDWVKISATLYPAVSSRTVYEKMWCSRCWYDVSLRLPVAA